MPGKIRWTCTDVGSDLREDSEDGLRTKLRKRVLQVMPGLKAEFC